MSNTIDLNSQEFPEGFPLFHTFNSLVDGTITHDDFLELNDKIKNDPAVTLQYLMFMQVVGELSFPADDLISDSKTTVKEQSNKSASNNKVNSFAKTLTLTACLLLGLISLGFGITAAMNSKPVICYLTPVNEVEWNYRRNSLFGFSEKQDSKPSSTRIEGRVSDQIELKKGILELSFTGGARININSPAVFEIRKGQCLFIYQGNIYADVKKQAKPVTIGTPVGWIRDIGTSFCVRVAEDTGCEIQVIEGNVVVSPTEQGTLQSDGVCMLNAKEAGVIRNKSELVQKITYGPDRFQDLLNTVSGITSTSQKVKIIKETRNLSLKQGGFESNNYVQLICEKTNVTPTKGFKYTYLKPGPWHLLLESKGFTTGKKVESGGRSFNSYIVHRDLIGNPQVPRVSDNEVSEYDLEVEITFDRPIVGVVEHGKDLMNSDSLFGNDGCIYPDSATDDANVRDIGENCKISISLDRHTIRMLLPVLVKDQSDGLKHHVDQLRILVEADTQLENQLSK